MSRTTNSRYSGSISCHEERFRESKCCRSFVSTASVRLGPLDPLSASEIRPVEDCAHHMISTGRYLHSADTRPDLKT